MDSLIIHPTATAQWKALVSEAARSSSIQLNEELESYLVFLLMRFSEHPELAHSVLATEFLESLEKIKLLKQESLRDVGDKCLLFAGLFPGNARRRRVRVSYYVDLGQRAYGFLSESYFNALAKLFSDLSDQFVELMDILHTMRELTSEQAVLDLLEAHELWNDTKSQHALNTLKRATGGVILPASTANNSEDEAPTLH